MGTGHVTGDDVSVRARFERFPATVKGAFVVRGEDANPHQIVFHEARVARVPAPGERPIPIAEVTLEVAPHKDLFVPFEFPIGELDPGWYDLQAHVDVDGSSRTMSGGRRFCVPWARSEVRSASVRVDRSVEVGDATVALERCQSGPEGLALRFSVRPSEPIGVRLAADGATLEVVEVEVDPASGKGTARGYPLLRAHRMLRIELSAGPGEAMSAQVEVEIPS